MIHCRFIRDVLMLCAMVLAPMRARCWGYTIRCMLGLPNLPSIDEQQRRRNEVHDGNLPNDGNE